MKPIYRWVSFLFWNWCQKPKFFEISNRLYLPLGQWPSKRHLSANWWSLLKMIALSKHFFIKISSQCGDSLQVWRNVFCIGMQCHATCSCSIYKLLLLAALLLLFVRSAKAWKSQLHPSTLPTHHHSTPGKVFWHNFQCWLIRFQMFDIVYQQRSLYWCMSYEGLACQELICWLLPNMDPKYHLYSAQPSSPDLW